MLYPRIIPCLLVRNGGLVKTMRFGASKYVGDPINAVKIFNEMEVDELIVLDIDASKESRVPDYRLIEHLAAECRMPFCYGGGIKTVGQALDIFSLGVEKIAMSSAAIENPRLVTAIADRVGSQSVVVVLDVKKDIVGGGYELFSFNGTKPTGVEPVAFASAMQRAGAGEVVVNSIDRDGVMSGYDLDLIDRVRAGITIPMTVLGGAGTINDIGEMMRRHGIIGIAAGSLFVYKGRFRAVLINYPTMSEKLKLISMYFNVE